MGNYNCSEHNQPSSDVSVLITDENVVSDENFQKVASKVTDKVYPVKSARHELITRIQTIPTDTLTYLTELICQLMTYTESELERMLTQSHQTYQVVIRTILKCKPKQMSLTNLPFLSESINNVNLLLETIKLPSTQLYHRPIYNEQYQLIREVKVNRHGQYVIKSDTVMDLDIANKRLMHWLQISNHRHPNILNLKAANISRNISRYLTEYIDGCTLDRLFNTKLGYKDKVKLAKQMVESVRFIHSMHLIHGDIKPTNFMVNDGTIILMDLDQLGSEGRSADMTYLYALTSNPSLIGDVWSLGLCLYQLFFGHKVEKGWYIHDYMARDSFNDNTVLIKLLEACLSKHPSKIETVNSIVQQL